MAIQSPPESESLSDQMRRGRAQVEELSSDAGELLREIQALARKELELARTEMAEQMVAARQAALFGAGAAVLGLLMLAFAATTLMFLLDEAMATWVAALITTIVLGALAGLCVAMLMSQIKRITVTPKKTMDSISEDVKWAKRQMSFNAK